MILKLKNIKKHTPVFRFFKKHRFLFFSKNFKFFYKIKSAKGLSFGKQVIKSSCSTNYSLKCFPKFNKLNFFNLYYVIGLQFNIKKQFSILKNKYNYYYVIPRIQFIFPGQLVYIFYIKQLYLLLILNCVCV